MSLSSRSDAMLEFHMLSQQNYIYQPVFRVPDFEQAVSLISGKYPKVGVGWVDPVPHLNNIREQLEFAGIICKDLVLATAPFAEYFWRAEYSLRYPDYYRGNLPEKALEHFIVVELFRLDAQSIFIDIASERPPLPETATRMFGSRSFAQDIVYEPGIRGDKIGGDACAMPLPETAATASTHLLSGVL